MRVDAASLNIRRKPGGSVASPSSKRERSACLIAWVMLHLSSPRFSRRKRVMAFALGGWAAGIAQAGEPVVAVSHKAAIRALFALATGWDMTGRPPVKLDWHRLHFFAAHRDGRVTVERLNVPMTGPA